MRAPSADACRPVGTPVWLVAVCGCVGDAVGGRIIMARHQEPWASAVTLPLGKWWCAALCVQAIKSHITRARLYCLYCCAVLYCLKTEDNCCLPVHLCFLSCSSNIRHIYVSAFGSAHGRLLVVLPTRLIIASQYPLHSEAARAALTPIADVNIFSVQSSSLFRFL